MKQQHLSQRFFTTSPTWKSPTSSLKAQFKHHLSPPFSLSLLDNFHSYHNALLVSSWIIDLPDDIVFILPSLDCGLHEDTYWYSSAQGMDMQKAVDADGLLIVAIQISLLGLLFLVFTAFSAGLDQSQPPMSLSHCLARYLQIFCSGQLDS